MVFSKNQFWISFHDWHPDLLIATKDTFLSIKENTMWKHNILCDSFCNYYGINYPFEVEIPVMTSQTVTTTRSIEYILEGFECTAIGIEKYPIPANISTTVSPKYPSIII